MEFIENEKNIQLWKTIPLDIFINHIIPYTYAKIDVNLLNDIRNFIFDYNMIINYYYFDMNECCLLNDIILFCNNDIWISIFEKIDYPLLIILNRNISFQKMSSHKKYDFIVKHFYFDISVKTTKKNRFLLSLLTPFERAAFINQYIIKCDGIEIE
jgi:hypothetical protein